MVWAARLVFALILLLGASSASAAIDRFSDDKGVIHITNQGGEKPRPEERDQEAPPRRLPRTPVAEPPREAEQPEAPAPEEPAKPNSYLTVRKGVIHITNVSERPESLAQAKAAPVQAAPASPSPAHDMREQPSAPIIPAAYAGAARPAAHAGPTPKLAGTPVSKYTDRQGVVHISNAPSPRPFNGTSMVAGWSSAPAAGQAVTANPAAAESGYPPTVLARKSEPGIIPLQQVALTAPLGADDFQALPSKASAPAPQADAGVRRFRDAKGVLHIVGRGPARSDRLQAPPDKLMARAPLVFPAAGGLQRTYPGKEVPGASLSGRFEPTILVRKNKHGKLVIGNAPARPLPKVDREEIRGRLEPILVEAAYLSGLPVSLIEAVIKVESNFQSAAVSPKGAMGLMQLMPGTADFLQVEEPFCPRQNILGGTRYLRLLLDFFGQSLPLALAAYNAGFQRVIDAGFQIPDIKETKDFVTKVMGHYFLREKQRYYQNRLIL